MISRSQSDTLYQVEDAKKKTVYDYTMEYLEAKYDITYNEISHDFQITFKGSREWQYLNLNSLIIEPAKAGVDIPTAKIMGYKKLDEVIELLSDELDGFNKAVDRLERLTQNVENINIRPDTGEIESMLREHLALEKANISQIDGSVQSISEWVSKVSLIPKARLWLHYTIWMVSLIVLGYPSFTILQINNIREKAFAEGQQQVISSLRGYFDKYPKSYESYRKWTAEKDSLPD